MIPVFDASMDAKMKGSFQDPLSSIRGRETIRLMLQALTEMGFKWVLPGLC
jgi:hypothetical protein